MKEPCGNCVRGLINSELCPTCNGTMFKESQAPKKESVVEKVKKVLKKK